MPKTQVMWAWVGLGISCAVALCALWRGTRPAVNFYETDVYGMTARTHHGYALVSLVFAAAFVAAAKGIFIPAVPLLAIYTLIAVFYFSSFARGFSDEQ